MIVLISNTQPGKPFKFDQIGEDEFLPRSNDKVQHLRLERDEQRNIIGVYLSGYQLKDLYYELM